MVKRDEFLHNEF
jgi:hypothetical protein